MTQSKPLDALTEVVKILTPLSSEERARTVQAAMIMLGEANPKLSMASDPLPDFSESAIGSLSPRAKTWMKQNSISLADLEQSFQRTADGVELLGAVPGKNKKEQTYNAYVLAGLTQLLASGEVSFGDKAARSLCESIGCYDNSNHSAYLRDKGNLFSGTKDKGWVLTVPGLKRAAVLVKEMTGDRHG